MPAQMLTQSLHMARELGIVEERDERAAYLDTRTGGNLAGDCALRGVHLLERELREALCHAWAMMADLILVVHFLIVLFIVGGLTTLAVAITGGVDTGWTFYTPYSSMFSNTYVAGAAMGVFITASTTIVDRKTGERFRGRVPPYSVVVPGSMPSPHEGGPNLYCVVIVKTVDAQTRSKTSINELLRD